MNKELADVVGTAAGICSMSSFVPQIIKILREKDASSVSLHMYMVTVTGFVLWTVYGVLLGSWPVWVSNSVNLTLAATILLLRRRFGAQGGSGVDSGGPDRKTATPKQQNRRS